MYSFKKYLLLLFAFSLFYRVSNGQDDESYIKANAIQIDNPDSLSDAIYKLLYTYPVIMFGEMHGTNESPQFVLYRKPLSQNKFRGLYLPFLYSWCCP